MPNYLERIYAAGAWTNPERRPGMAAPARIPGVILPPVLPLDHETLQERSGPIATTVQSEAQDLIRQEAAPTPRQTGYLRETMFSKPEPTPLESKSLSAPRMTIATPQSQPAISSVDEAGKPANLANPSTEKVSRATESAPKASGYASKDKEGLIRRMLSFQSSHIGIG